MVNNSTLIYSSDKIWPLDEGFRPLRDFVRRALPLGTLVEGPVATYAAYDDGPDPRVTVRFVTDDREHPEVVVKLNLFPLLRNSPAAHGLVSRCSPDSVPRVLACESGEEGSLILLATFEGTTVEKLNDLAPLLEMARTLGRVQVECTQASRSTVGLQTLEPEDLIHAFRECVEGIESHFDAWTHNDGRLQRAMGFPGDQVLAKLDSLRPRLEVWVDMLTEADVDLSIEHGDAHAGNAVQRPDGSVLIFDWENACRSHPFFSAEKMLTSGWALDAGTSGGPWGYVRNTPSQDALKIRYLEAFGPPTDRRKRAFDAAMGLAVIKEMHHEMEWARQCGWQDLNPEWTAQLVNRLTQHAARAA